MGGESVLTRVKALATAGLVAFSDHAQGRLEGHNIDPDEVYAAIAVAILLEDYPNYHKGPCCLIYGDTTAGRPIHVVCSTTLPELIIITIYEPRMPKWRTPTERNR